MSGMTNPIVKWAGGKCRLVPVLESRFPRQFDTYHEPFVGGAALFLATQPPRAVLADANERLIRMYKPSATDLTHLSNYFAATPMSRSAAALRPSASRGHCSPQAHCVASVR